MSDERRSCYRENAQQTVGMLWLQNEEDNGEDVENDESLVEHLGAYLVVMLLSQEVDDARQRENEDETERQQHLRVGMFHIGQWLEMGNGREMVDEEISITRI